MESEGSLSHSQQSATCLYPEPDQSSPCPTSWRSISILSSHLQPASSEWSPFLGSPHQYSVYTSPFTYACYIPHPFHSSWIDNPNNLVRSTDHTASPLCSLLHSPCSWSLLDPNKRLSTLLTNTLGLLFSLNVSGQVSHPFKTTGKAIVLYILIYILLYSKLENKRFFTEWQQVFPDFSMLLIPSWMELRFIRIVPKYLNCSTISKVLLST